MRGPSRFALFTLSGLLGPGLVSCDTCNSPTWTTPGPWDSVTLDAGTITLCPEFCVHFELNTVGASDDEYEAARRAVARDLEAMERQEDEDWSNEFLNSASDMGDSGAW